MLFVKEAHMNSSSVLERQVVVESLEMHPGEMHELQTQLAEKTKGAGYSFLWDTIHAPSQVAELRKVLRDLDIQPFSPASVEEYKRRARKKLNRKTNFVLFTGLGFFLLIPFLMVGGFHYDSVWLITGTTVSGITGGLMVSFSHFMRWNWQLVHLSGYRKPVPEFVLETACRIKDSMPQATLCIEELVQNQEVNDPFLVVQAGTSDTVQETYYVEVFKEPRFERLEGTE